MNRFLEQLNEFREAQDRAEFLKGPLLEVVRKVLNLTHDLDVNELFYIKGNGSSSFDIAFNTESDEEMNWVVGLPCEIFYAEHPGNAATNWRHNWEEIKRKEKLEKKNKELQALEAKAKVIAEQMRRIRGGL